jgi:hypothetical protein
LGGARGGQRELRPGGRAALRVGGSGADNVNMQTHPEEADYSGCEPSQPEQAALCERRSGERRSKFDRRRGPGRRRTDYRRAAEEGCMNEEQSDFIQAIDEYKRVNNRPFPSWTEILEVVLYLGYRRVAPVGEFGLTKPRQTPLPAKARKTGQEPDKE